MSERSGLNDFDFFMGDWNIRNRRLKERLKGCTDWEEFGGTCSARKILNGMGNMDEGTFHRESGDLHGVTIRIYDPQTQQWRIYWGSSKSGTLDIPMIGGFQDGRGEFYAHEPHEGRYVYSRFIWSKITANSCQWEQALSEDGGNTWETNWIMEFTRQE